tara:strand:- start:223 stop:1401 length:1179 start_codon:yes stop_codon:yes gene_type:complete
MKVCVISPSYYPAFIYGGPIFSTHSACLALANLGVDIRVSTTNANGSNKLNVVTNKYYQFSENYKVKYYNDTVIGRFSLSFLLNIYKDIKECDIVKIEDVFSTYIPISIILSILYKKKIIVSTRGVFNQWALRNKRRLIKKIWIECFMRPFASRILWHATSPTEKVEILRLFTNNKVIVIPNGIQINDYIDVPELSKIKYLNKFTNSNNIKLKIIVSMGRLNVIKGFPLLVKAFSLLLREMPNVMLLIAGRDDGVHLELIKIIKDLEISDKVLLLGEVKGENKIQLMKGADVFALTSYSENFGLVYLEALAAGTPIITSNGTPWNDIDKYGCGKCVDYNIVNIKDSIKEILNTKKSIMSVNAIRYAQRFSVFNVGNLFLDTFKNLLKNKCNA